MQYIDDFHLQINAKLDFIVIELFDLVRQIATPYHATEVFKTLNKTLSDRPLIDSVTILHNDFAFILEIFVLYSFYTPHQNVIPFP